MEYERRTHCDFLAETNHEGEHLDFHSLRHTCGAWLARSGAHPKEVQAVMRHSSITLTMDTYGHLFPGQEAETVARFPAMLDGEPTAFAATGTNGHPPQIPQQSACEPMRHSVSPCDDTDGLEETDDVHKFCKDMDICDAIQLNARTCRNWPGRTRTSNLLIQSQAFCQLNYGP